MELGKFLDLLVTNPHIVIIYGVIIPIIAVLIGVIAKGKGHESPWKYIYATLIYLVCIPGIFVFTLDIYQLIFTRQSILKWDVYTQIMPIIIMIATLYIISTNFSFKHIPGFDRISGLISALMVVIILLWILQKTHLIAFTQVPIVGVILILLILMAILRVGVSRIFK